MCREAAAVAGCLTAFGQRQFLETPLSDDPDGRLQHAPLGFFASFGLRTPAPALVVESSFWSHGCACLRKRGDIRIDLFVRQQINLERADLSTSLLKPELYGHDHAGNVVLRGGKCRCGYVFFPWQDFGCEQCGVSGDALVAMDLAGAGELIASSQVHLHADESRPVPFVVGTIALDDGPVIRTLLTCDAHAPARMRAVLEPVSTGGHVLDLRFAPESSR